VAGELQSSRGAVYKVLHDARTKLRRRLEHEGHLEQEGAR
jgi:DNA-directed RNA polymerase specialized sigma24 family protein